MINKTLVIIKSTGTVSVMLAEWKRYYDDYDYVNNEGCTGCNWITSSG